GELGENRRLGGRRRGELQSKIQILEEVRLDEILVGPGKIDGGGRCWGRFTQVRRECTYLVTGLDLFDIWHVIGAEKLGAIDSERELRRRPAHLLDASRRLPLPVRPDNHVVAGLVARRAAAD